MLKSDDEHVVFAALNEIMRDDKYRTISLLPTIANILEEKTSMDISYGMLLDFLVSNRYSCSLMFKNNGQYYLINPSELTEACIAQAKLMNQALSHIQSNEKNISIGDFVMKVMVKGSYQLPPRYLVNISELASFICAAYQLASYMFKVTIHDDKVLDFYDGLSNEKLTDEFLGFLKKIFH